MTHDYKEYQPNQPPLTAFQRWQLRVANFIGTYWLEMLFVAWMVLCVVDAFNGVDEPIDDPYYFDRPIR